MGKGSFREQVVSGLIWKFGERIIAQGISFIISMILARILMPKDYGTVSLILVFITLANVFVSNGLGDALIQKKNADELDFSTIFYCSVALSLLLYAIVFSCAKYIAMFYRNKDLIPLIRVLALQIPFASMKTIQHSYVSKYMLFKKFFWSTLCGTLVSGFVGIIMATRGYGAWALIVQYLLNSVMDMTVLLFTIKWRPKLMFSVERAKVLIGYGWRLMLSSFINTLYSELRSLILGKNYSSTDLAYYNKGNQFPALVLNNLNTSISMVLFPAMTTVGDEKENLKRLTRRSMRISSYVVFPMMAGLIAIAKPLINLLLTEKWLPCVPFLQMCCIYWAFQPLQTANVQAIKAAGRADICLKLEIIKKIIGFALLFSTMWISVEAIVMSNVLFGGISMLINIYPNKKIINYGYMEQMKDIFPSFLLSCCMGLIVYCISFINISDIFVMLLQICVGVLFYVGGSILFKIDSFEYFVRLVNMRRKK